MSITELPIPGALRLHAAFHADARGGFAKPYSAAAQAVLPGFTVAEVFWSRSVAGVVRGLHFQTPPTAVAKLVFVTQGRIRDVIVDLRADSPSYGKHASVELDDTGDAIFVPVGCAHGFEVLQGPAVTCYLQGGGFDPATDAGIRWDSAGVSWASAEPLLSDRDRSLPALAELPALTAAQWGRREPGSA
jgi:dTDP-4-dehydrorhamnose 3,5-epimerase